MFAEVSVLMPEGAAKVVLPSTSIAYAAYGNTIFVVEKMKDKNGQEYLGVRQQPVETG